MEPGTIILAALAALVLAVAIAGPLLEWLIDHNDRICEKDAMSEKWQPPTPDEEPRA